MKHTFTAHAKWILAGEHAVMRGSPALVFPLKKYQCILEYEPADSLTIVSQTDIFKEVIYQTLEFALEIIGENAQTLTGKFQFQNTIPKGQGLGFSAALSTVVGQWIEAFYPLISLRGFDLYRRIEDKFHGLSSGLDIAGVSAIQGLYYKKGELPQPIFPLWRPKLYLTFSAQQGSTRRCVEKVKQLWTDKPTQAQQLQNAMMNSVELCYQALNCTEKEGFALLVEGIERAQRCFTKWGLDSEHEAIFLIKKGATAAKPTGSGKGCYISLWLQNPPTDFNGIALFHD